FILTLNWAEASSVAHNLDAQLSPIEGKSREGFVFSIDLQVQIHVPDTKAPKVISMVGSMQNLVNEVLQAAVGNHFRNTLQALAEAQVSVDINIAKANARKAEADGEAKYVELTGAAEGSRRRAIGLGDAAATEALGLARAKGYDAQIRSLGSGPTAVVAVANAVAEGKLTIVPEVLVTGGGGAVEGLAAALMRSLNGNGHAKRDDAKDKPPVSHRKQTDRQSPSASRRARALLSRFHHIPHRRSPPRN